MKSYAPFMLIGFCFNALAFELEEDMGAIFSEWDIGSTDEMTVLTPTRIGQSIDKTPGTVTVLTRKDLLNRGINSIPEALRLVPGMSVLNATGFSQNSGHDYQISYHGGSARVSRRLQVQIDGMSVYLGGLSKIDWSQFPATVHDIERIEVTRNPGAATYGANSFSAVINVITQHSRDFAGNEAVVEGGTRDDHFASYRYSHIKGGNSFSLRASTERDGGYDTGDSTRVHSDLWDGHRDTMEVNRLAIRFDSQIDKKTRFTGHAGAVAGEYETEYVVASQDPSVLPDTSIDDYYLNFQFSRSHSKVSETRLRVYTKQSELQQDFRACAPFIFVLPGAFELVRSNRDYFETILSGGLPSGGSQEDDQLAATLLQRALPLGAQVQETVCGTLNQDYVDKRHHATLEHHRVIGKSLHFVGGLTYEKLSNNSDTYFNGTVSSNIYSAFFNAQYEPLDHLTMNAGVFVESADDHDDTNYNPRISLNWHATGNATIRLVANHAFRSPDLAETDRHWSYEVLDIAPVIDGVEQSSFAEYASSENFKLEPEEITAYELGVFASSTNKKHVLDARIFYEELSNLISEKPFFSNFDLSNSEEGTNKGFEISLASSLNDSFTIDVAYSYQDQEFEQGLESGLIVDHQGQAALIYEHENRVVTAAYVGNSTMSQYSFDQWSLTWIESLTIQSKQIDLCLHLQYSPSTFGFAEEDIGLLRTFTYDDDTYAKLSASFYF